MLRSRKVILQSFGAIDASQRARRRLDQVLQWAAGQINTRGRATQSEAFEEIRLFRGCEQDSKRANIRRKDMRSADAEALQQGYEETAHRFWRHDFRSALREPKTGQIDREQRML